ncbi:MULTISPECIES: helix-hairpin-helix domain-containing protein [unclassified Enterococcus]|uniref:helix-hairpin-helix domain-containing protein n=1 Tax=unclassified Enterococcus TaxID=2608891 RepID=UPI003D291B3B
MEKIKRIPRPWLIGSCISLLMLLFMGYFLWQRTTDNENEMENLWLSQQIEAAEEPTTEGMDDALDSSPILYVDIKGSVQQPGIYQVEEGDRLYDVIQQAGGLIEGADEQQVNLAARVADQQMIYIPQIGEEIPMQMIETVMPQLSAEETADGKININTADVNELRGLSGIGEKRAQDIIAYREENGSFQTIEELQEVSGIGEKTVENLRSSVTIK